jgi:hypothetical protein
MNKIDIRTVEVVQYVHPLREGGSLPAIVKADDGFLYVLKFRGAGQGKKALVAEFIGGELARAMDLKVPELVFMNLDDSFSKTEPDEEIQDLLKFSVGLNLGLHFLSSAITYDPLVSEVDPWVASKVVILDSLIIKDQVLLPKANKLKEAAVEIQQLLSQDKIIDIISKIPEDWLLSESDSLTPSEMRAAYIEFINAKLSMIDVLVKEAEDAR